MGAKEIIALGISLEKYTKGAAMATSSSQGLVKGLNTSMGEYDKAAGAFSNVSLSSTVKMELELSKINAGLQTSVGNVTTLSTTLQGLGSQLTAGAGVDDYINQLAKLSKAEKQRIKDIEELDKLSATARTGGRNKNISASTDSSEQKENRKARAEAEAQSIIDGEKVVRLTALAVKGLKDYKEQLAALNESQHNYNMLLQKTSFLSSIPNISLKEKLKLMEEERQAFLARSAIERSMFGEAEENAKNNIKNINAELKARGLLQGNGVVFTDESTSKDVIDLLNRRNAAE
jgi:hypothetical protein